MASHEGTEHEIATHVRAAYRGLESFRTMQGAAMYGMGMGGGRASRERAADAARRATDRVNELSSVRRPPVPNRPSRWTRLVHRVNIRRLIRAAQNDHRG